MVHICRGDADAEIVLTALELSKGSNVIVVVHDTDVAVILLYHYQNQISDINFLQGRGKKSRALKTFSKKLHAKNICFLYMHGQDVTLRHQYLEKGKKIAFMKMVEKSENVQSASEVMWDYWATKEEITETSIFVEMYGGTKDGLLKKSRQAFSFFEGFAY